MAAVPYTPEITNNVSLETGEDDEDKKLRKKGCC